MYKYSASANTGCSFLLCDVWVEIMEVGDCGPLASLPGLIQRPLDFLLR